MRTPAEGLLTTADAMALTSTSIALAKSAHADDFALAMACAHCRKVMEALADWLAAHAAGPEDYEEMERLSEDG